MTEYTSPDWIVGLIRIRNTLRDMMEAMQIVYDETGGQISEIRILSSRLSDVTSEFDKTLDNINRELIAKAS